MKSQSNTADLLADIGAVDASLMSLPLEDLERMQFFVEERERLLTRLADALPQDSNAPEKIVQLQEIRRRTFVLSGRLTASRELVLGSLRQAGESLQSLKGYELSANAAEENPSSNGQLLTSLA